MIKTAMQLKAKVKNLAGGDSNKSQTLIRNFVMERFLERMSCSQYRNNFILKGGMLVASVVGLDTRATMDIDTTVRSINLDKETAAKVVDEIISIDLEDGIQFRITKASEIMEEHDYQGVRLILEGTLENLRQAIKLDISTGDVITPSAVEYSYQLMFEDRTISILTYNLETLLAEKLETIMSRSTANTRMRDYYDIHVLSGQENINSSVLKKAFIATSKKRNTASLIPDLSNILDSIESDVIMEHQWEKFRDGSVFVGQISWAEAMTSVKDLASLVVCT